VNTILLENSKLIPDILLTRNTKPDVKFGYENEIICPTLGPRAFGKSGQLADQDFAKPV
jgi:hypothetical protein